MIIVEVCMDIVKEFLFHYSKYILCMSLLLVLNYISDQAWL